MIKPKCHRCKQELKEFGGLVFAPPFDKEYPPTLQGLVEKFHICRDCFIKLVIWLNRVR